MKICDDCKLISGFSKLLSILHVLTCKLFLGRVSTLSSQCDAPVPPPLFHYFSKKSIIPLDKRLRKYLLTITIYVKENFIGSLPVQHFLFQRKMLIESVNTLKFSLFIIKNKHLLRNMINF